MSVKLSSKKCLTVDLKVQFFTEKFSNKIKLRLSTSTDHPMSFKPQKLWFAGFFFSMIKISMLSICSKILV